MTWEGTSSALSMLMKSHWLRNVCLLIKRQNHGSNSAPVSGPDPITNPRLALAITRAKKDGFPKASIEAAIARGQGVSASGAKLESVTIEAMIPPSVAVVVDSQTDSKLRTLNEIRLIIKEHGGQVAPTGYLFDRKGEIVFRPKDGVGVDEILETAVEAGVLDIEEGLEGRLIVYSEPSATKHVSDVLMRQFGLTVESSEIIWDPNTRADLDSDASATNLVAMIDKLNDNSAVQGVYLNAARGATKDEVWDELESRVFA